MNHKNNGKSDAMEAPAAVHRLLRGEAHEMASRELNVPVHRLSQWRDRVPEAGMIALKEQERDARDDEIARLKAKIGDINITKEHLYAKIDQLEAGRPLAPRRSMT